MTKPAPIVVSALPAQANVQVRRWPRPRMVAGLLIVLAGVVVLSMQFAAYVQAHPQIASALPGGLAAALVTALG